ncbi:uncharacterized protein [Coffea arabica]|uniref:FAR1 domain-containing protein n=1 Tax=Coffea arabica TaxID=13443 RepID=A0ABM4VZP9_COFAR
MQFDSDMDAYECYSNYAAMKGFIVRKKYINRDKDGMITSRWFTCCKESRRQLDEQDKRTRMYSAHTKTGCGARMGISLNRILKKYVVADFSSDLMAKPVGSAYNIGCKEDDVKKHLSTRRERSLNYGEAGSF